MGSTQVSDVLFLHGFLGLPQDFDPCFQKLKIKNVKAIDYTKVIDLSPDVYLSDWGQSFLRAQAASPRISAVGYSQGGRLLLGAFKLDPDRFDKLILISSHSGLKTHNEKEDRLASDRKWAQSFRKLEWNQLMSQWRAQPVFQKGIDLERFENDFDRETLAQCFENWSLAHQPDYSEMIQNHKNIHVIVGEWDQKYLNLYSNLGSRLQITKGAAHRVPSDQPIHLAENLDLIL